MRARSALEPPRIDGLPRKTAIGDPAHEDALLAFVPAAHNRLGSRPRQAPPLRAAEHSCVDAIEADTLRRAGSLGGGHGDRLGIASAPSDRVRMTRHR